MQEPKKIPLTVLYDEEMDPIDLEERMTLALAYHNPVRRTLRNEEFVVERVALLPSEDAKGDGSYFLNSLLRCDPAETTVYVMGQQTGFHTRGKLVAFGGVSQPGSRKMIVNGRIPLEQFCKTFTHEAFHAEGAYDLELPGKDSTYNTHKSVHVFEIDLGSEQLIREGREFTGEEIKASIEQKITGVRTYFTNPDAIGQQLADLILHERVTASPEYLQTVREILLCGVEKEPGAFHDWLDENERKPRALVKSDNDATGKAYWEADDAYKREDDAYALCAISEADAAYHGEDGRIKVTIGAAERAILDRMTGGMWSIVMRNDY
jgi:hypothetical protein